MTPAPEKRICAMGRHALMLALVIAMAFCVGVPEALAQPYEPGNGALEIWNAQGMASAPLWVQIWLVFEVLTFLAGLFFVRTRVEARWVVGGFFAMLLVSNAMVVLLSITPLVGYVALNHVIYRAPGLYLLLTRRPFLKERSSYAFWSALMTGALLFSLIFDLRDAAIYLDHLAGTGLLS